jgi:Uma2 family endonuclease
LVVEILSPSDRFNRVLRKVNEYLIAGVRLVWVVDPEDKVVLIYRPGMQALEVVEGQNLEGYDALPGSACRWPNCSRERRETKMISTD